MPKFVVFIFKVGKLGLSALRTPGDLLFLTIDALEARVWWEHQVNNEMSPCVLGADSSPPAEVIALHRLQWLGHIAYARSSSTFSSFLRVPGKDRRRNMAVRL